MSGDSRLIDSDHPIAEMFNSIDRNTIERMLGKGVPGGATECFGMRDRNSRIEVFERGTLRHVMWCNNYFNAGVVSSTLNNLVRYLDQARMVTVSSVRFIP